MNVEFLPESHTYYCDGNLVPSVTQILHRQGIAPQYSGVAPSVLDKASARGTLIHEEIQRYIDDGEVGMTEEFGEFIRICEEENLHFERSEVVLCDGNVAGTADLIGSHKGKRLLADVKTTVAEDREYWRWQLGLYDRIGALEVKEFAVLHLRPGRGTLVMLTPPSAEEISAMLDADSSSEIYAPPEIVTPELMRAAAEAERAEKEAKDRLAEIKSRLAVIFAETGATAAENKDVKVSYLPPRKSERIDTTRLKAEQPELAKLYTVSSISAGGVKITLKGAKKCSPDTSSE